MKEYKFMQALLAYAKRRGITDHDLRRYLHVRHGYLTQIRKGGKMGGDIKIENLTRTVNHFLHEEQKNIELLEKCNKTDTRAYAETQECISMLQKALSLSQDAIILYHDTYPDDKNPLWTY